MIWAALLLLGLNGIGEIGGLVRDQPQPQTTIVEGLKASDVKAIFDAEFDRREELAAKDSRIEEIELGYRLDRMQQTLDTLAKSVGDMTSKTVTIKDMNRWLADFVRWLHRQGVEPSSDYPSINRDSR